MAAPTITTPFDYDLAAARAVYDATGYFHAPGGVSHQLMASLTEQVAKVIGSDDHELANWRYPEKKEQFLCELPPGLPVEALCRVVAETTGMDPDKTVLSERHLKVYSASAPDLPPPHKDRSASTVTVGIGVDIPADSLLVLWPDVEPEFNPFPSAADWRNSRHPEELPEVVTAGTEPTEIDLRRGDVVLFRGANFYHERYRPACTTVLYLKFNDRGLDPLGEDPRTITAEDETRRVLAGSLRADHSVRRSPRLISVLTEELFPDLGTIHTARTFADEHGVRLTVDEAATLRLLAAHPDLRVDQIPAPVATIERLARFGLVVVS